MTDLSAVKLLMRDIAPEPGSNVVLLPGTPGTDPSMKTSSFPVLPVADLIICECRICKACGSVKSHTSSRVHRLLSSCRGDPLKKIVRLRRKDEMPLDTRCVRVVEIFTDHCQECWDENTPFTEAFEIVPERPPVRLFTLPAGDAAKARKDPKKAKATINQMTAEQAAEFL